MVRILFAEDGLTAMNLAGGLFDNPDIALDVVTDGRSALDRVNAEPNAYGLVVLGYNLPEISGPECAAFLKKMYRRLPVLMLTDAGDDDRIGELLRIGIRKPHILQKPTDRNTFAAWVQQALADVPLGR